MGEYEDEEETINEERESPERKNSNSNNPEVPKKKTPRLVRIFKPEALSQKDLFELIYCYTNNFKPFNLVGEELKEENDNSSVNVRYKQDNDNLGCESSSARVIYSRGYT